MDQITEKQRVCFGKSGIHGWGLFARRDIHEGEMVSDCGISLLHVWDFISCLMLLPSAHK